MVCFRLAVVAIILVASGNIAAAGPIYSDQSKSKPNHGLTAEQLAILDQLSDHGWHLGWFKDKRNDLPGEDVRPDGGLGNLPDLGLGNVGLPGIGELGGTLLPGVGQVPQPLDTGLAVSEVAAVPEPATLLLLGGGLAGIAAKVRKRRRQ